MEQYFCATNQNRTKKYALVGSEVKPVFETDNTNENYKKEVTDANVLVCKKFAYYYSFIINMQSHLELCRKAISVYADFLRAPRIECLLALEKFEQSNSSLRKMPLLSKQNIFKLIIKRKTPWLQGDLVYNSFFPNITAALIQFLIKRKYKNN
jgi:hypothetical protein